MIVERSNDRLSLTVGQGRWTHRSLQKHRFTQFEIAHPERLQSATPLRELREQIGNRVIQVKSKFACGLIGVEEFALRIEDDHRFAEAVEHRFR